MKYTMIFCVMLCTLALFGQEQRADRMQKIESTRIAYITNTLELTPKESEQFWPIYNGYTNALKDMRKQIRGDRQSRDGSSLAGLNDQEAAKLIDDYLVNEQKKVDLKADLMRDLSGKLSNQKIIKLFFAEEQFKREMLSKIKESMDNRRVERRKGQGNER